MRGPHPCLWLSPGLQGSEARRLFPQPPAQPLLKGKNTESCRLALSSLTEERPAAGLTEWVLMKPDSPAEKTAPLPRGLYFSMTSLEGAVNPPRSFHRIAPHRGRAEGTRRGSLPATPAWKGPQVLQGPPGPRAGQLQMLLQCGSLSHHDVPEEKRSHLHFFFLSWSFLKSWNFRVKRKYQSSNPAQHTPPMQKHQRPNPSILRLYK